MKKQALLIGIVGVKDSDTLEALEAFDRGKGQAVPIEKDTDSEKICI